MFLLWISIMAHSTVGAKEPSTYGKDSLDINNKSRTIPVNASPLIYISEGTVISGIDKITISNKKEKLNVDSRVKKESKKSNSKKEVQKIKIQELKQLVKISRTPHSESFFSNQTNQAAAIISAPSYSKHIFGILKNSFIVILPDLNKKNKIVSSPGRAAMFLFRGNLKVRPPPIT